MTLRHPTRSGLMLLASVAAAALLAAPLPGTAQQVDPSRGTAAPPRPRSELPFRRDDSSEPAAGGALRSMVAALVVLAVTGGSLLAARARMRRAGSSQDAGRARFFGWLAPAAGGSAVQLVQSTRLTPRATVHVLRWGGKELLVGCTDAGMSVLGQRDEAPAPGREPA